MKQFVDYLAELKDLGSPPIAKLHKLCVPFLNLATSTLESPEGNIESSNEKAPVTRATIEQSPNMIPGTTTFQAIPPPVPRLSVPNQIIPMMDNSVLQDTNMTPPSFPTFTSAPTGGVFWQLMDAQPRLQWLDSDFSGFEQAWGDAGFGDPEYMG
jgi:hypothetical protein